MNLKEITSLAAPELDVYARLTQGQLRSKQNPAQGVLIAESATAVHLALNAGYQPLSLLVERRQLQGAGGEIAARVGEIPVYTADDSVLEALTGFHLTRGVLCAMRRKPLPPVEEVLQNARRIAVLEGIMDSTNIGAIFRSAAALGMDAVLTTPDCCDPLCRRSIRVSMGTIFQVPWTCIGTDAADWYQNGIALLHGYGFQTAAMALSDRSICVDDPQLRRADKLAVMMGTEGTGLAKETIAKSDYTVKIPMCNGVDSLNVAAASAVAFWELRVTEYTKTGSQAQSPAAPSDP